jgi:hypothetical protein
MSRAFKLVAILCLASLLGNAWLYRELKVRERAAPPHVSSVLPQAQSAIPEVAITSAPLVNAASEKSKLSPKQMADKCKKKWEDEFRHQFQDPKEREKLKRGEIQILQSFNVGAATRLHLNEQTFSRIVELQAEQNLVSREASIGRERMSAGVSVNPQIADEFGESVASKWTEYLRESSGRTAVQGVANMFADANVPLSEDQRRRLVSVYTDAFEMQSAQDSGPDMQFTPGDGNPRAVAEWLQKLEARQVAFEQRVQADSASFLTRAQLELLQKKSDVDTERLRSVVVNAPEEAENTVVPSVEC